MTYTLEQKQAHNAIARALVRGDTMPNAIDAPLRPSSPTPARGLPHDPVSDDMYTTWQELDNARKELETMVGLSEALELHRQAQTCIKLRKRLEKLQLEYKQRSTVKGGRIHDSNLYCVALEKDVYQLEITILLNADSQRLEIADWHEIEQRAGRWYDTAPPRWRDLAAWLQRMTEEADGRILNTDPDEFIWHWHVHQLRPRGYVQTQYPCLIEALETLRLTLDLAK